MTHSPWKVSDHDWRAELGFLELADVLHSVSERRLCSTVICNKHQQSKTASLASNHPERSSECQRNHITEKCKCIEGLTKCPVQCTEDDNIFAPSSISSSVPPPPPDAAPSVMSPLTAVIWMSPSPPVCCAPGPVCTPGSANSHAGLQCECCITETEPRVQTGDGRPLFVLTTTIQFKEPSVTCTTTTDTKFPSLPRVVENSLNLVDHSGQISVTSPSARFAMVLPVKKDQDGTFHRVSPKK